MFRTRKIASKSGTAVSKTRLREIFCIVEMFAAQLIAVSLRKSMTEFCDVRIDSWRNARQYVQFDVDIRYYVRSKLLPPIVMSTCIKSGHQVRFKVYVSLALIPDIERSSQIARLAVLHTEVCAVAFYSWRVLSVIGLTCDPDNYGCALHKCDTDVRNHRIEIVFDAKGNFIPLARARGISARNGNYVNKTGRPSIESHDWSLCTRRILFRK